MVKFDQRVVGRRWFLRTASVVMACHAYNAIAPHSEAPGRSHEFTAAWQPIWPFKVLTLYERHYHDDMVES